MSKKSASSKSHPRRSRKKTAAVKKVVFVFLGGAMALLFAVIGLTTLEAKPGCANSISCIKDLTGAYEEGATTGIFQGKTVAVPSQTTLSYTNPSRSVLGESTAPKLIKIDLSSQHLFAYEGDAIVMDFPVSTGKWRLTPTGTYNIWIKLRYTRMSGGSGADYYNLPNVPYTMFFANAEIPRSDGFGIHGAYWHNNFGHPMSHGCVNMRVADAGQLFVWADPPGDTGTIHATKDNPGTEIIISGETPEE